MEKTHRPTWMQLQVGLSVKTAVTTGLMLALIAFVYLFHIPNPNMILIAGLVFCSALYGFGGGGVAAVIMLGYTLFFFSTDHSFTRFTPENMQKVFVTLLGVAADMLFVCFLKRAEVRAFNRAEALTKELHRENQTLHHISTTDALTGVRNRAALRADIGSYVGREVVVMMLDLNDFKIINDTRGHEEGDRILKAVGGLLADAFGAEHCYRYGGDEFLVLTDAMPDAEVRAKIASVADGGAALDGGVTFSVGYVRETLGDPERFADLMARADERMYQAKRDKGSATAAAERATPETTLSEHSVREMRALLAELSGQYDLARVVDPIECRILDLREDGKLGAGERCYGIWNAEQRCINCTSAVACRTGCHQKKIEHFQDQVYSIQSNPVSLRLDDGTVYDAVLELVEIGAETERAANDREAENVGARAAHYLAQHDRLTGVLNAEAFYELARERVGSGPEQTWVMVSGNIMSFRLANTLYGVTRGNEILVRTAALLREIAEDGGGLCGRLGGDQFALLLPEEAYREERLLSVARRLSEDFNSGVYTLCIHFGVYRVDDASVPVSVMCGRANSALRTIREDLGRTVAYFNDEISKKLLFEQMVIGGFEEALADGQFQMYLQPLVGKQGDAVGAEALVRWHRPDGTVLMPGDFIETLENAGLIQKLDRYIWEQAAKQLGAWKGTEREHLTISVNMSAKDFYSIDVYAVLTGLTEQYGIDSRMLRLEITETALLVEPDKSDAIVSSLRERGFVVEIDDFGKGYSSLSLLKNIRADVLKIDMSFLREIRDRERSRIILKSVIDLADSLGMDVITEGVETEQQLNALSEMGCSHFQGYYFSRPIPVREFERAFVGKR